MWRTKMLSSLDRRHCSKVKKNFFGQFKGIFEIRAEATVKKKTVNWARTKLTLIV